MTTHDARLADDNARHEAKTRYYAPGGGEPLGKIRVAFASGAAWQFEQSQTADYPEAAAEVDRLDDEVKELTAEVERLEEELVRVQTERDRCESDLATKSVVHQCCEEAQTLISQRDQARSIAASLESELAETAKSTVGKITPLQPSAFYIRIFQGTTELYHQCHSLHETEEGEFVTHVESGMTLEKLDFAVLNHTCEPSDERKSS